MQNQKSNRFIIEKLSPKSFSIFLNWVDSNDFHRNDVFVAKFNHPAKGEIDAFVKLYPYDGGENRGLINEITGYLFAHALNVPQPATAFIANIPMAALRGLDNLPDGHFLRIAKNKQPHYPAFCTERLDGKSAGLHLPRSMYPTLIKDISSWQSLPNAIVLDENIAHCDRHFNNLIRLGPKKYAAIDNGRLICEDSEYWQHTMLDYSKLYDNRLSDLIFDHQPNNSMYSKITDHASNILDAIKPIEAELKWWFNLFLEKSDDESFTEFLFKRAEQLVWLINKRYNRLH